jgi:biotin operon repressor
MQLFRKEKSEQENTQPLPKEAILAGATLELLRDLSARLDRLYLKVDRLERLINERMPEKALSESTFKQEIVDTEDVVNRIVSEIKAATRPIIASKNQLTIVEQRRIEKIMSLLQDQGKLSSSQLSQIMGLSRTRCNEYFKQMEDLGLVEGIEMGKEKYYKLKD